MVENLAGVPTASARCHHLRRWLQFQEPPFDIFGAMMRKGLVLDFTAFGTIAGALLRDPTGEEALIVVNSDQPDDRLRFSAAHDLAHLASRHEPEHMDIYDYFGPSRTREEREADAMAAELLMPVRHLATAARKLDGTEDLDVQVYRLADEFQVSYAAMAVRLGGLGALTADDVEDLRKTRPTDLENRLHLRERRDQMFVPDTVLPDLIDDFVEDEYLPPRWYEAFELETGPSYLRAIQSAALRKYILATKAKTRRHSVNEVYEMAARWVAEQYPWG